MRAARSLLLFVALAVSACAAVPRPGILGEVDAVRVSPGSKDAQTYAPGAHAHAEKLRREAEAAAEADDLAGAQILGERAVAAYAHARALARVARAEAASSAAEGELSKSLAELRAIESDQTRVAAEVDALELRVRVARDAQPVVPSGPADPAREKARLAAAKALALQARLLCGAARLLMAGTPPPPGADAVKPELEAATASLQKLDGLIEPRPGSGGAAPIDLATRSREGCLAVLTKVRRAATPIGKAPGAGDALLSALSATGASPSRDDRGVFVTLRGIFDKQGLSKAGEEKMLELGKVAAAHPDFPVTVVIHQDREGVRDDATWRARADALVTSLKGGRAARVEAVLAGAALPVVDPAGKDRARNARVEVVFVTPEAF